MFPPIISFPRRNLFRSKDTQEPCSRDNGRDRSRSPAVRFIDGRDKTGLEGFVTFGRSEAELLASSPTAVVSSSPAPLPKSWAELSDQDEDALWEIFSNQPLDEDKKENRGSGTQAEAPLPEDEEDTLVATPEKKSNKRSISVSDLFEDDEGTLESAPKKEKESRKRSNSKRRISVQELFQVYETSAEPTGILSDPVPNVFKTPETSQNTKRGHHYKQSSQRPESSSSNRSGRTSKTLMEMETDIEVLKRRQKQIDFGKNTIGYQNYIQVIDRTKRTKVDPRTPDKFVKYSRRSWDQIVKIWRQKLHAYDPNDGEHDQEMDISEIMSDLSFDSKVISTGCSSPVSSYYLPTSSPLCVSDDSDFNSDQGLTGSEDFASESEGNEIPAEEALDLLADLTEEQFLQ